MSSPLTRKQLKDAMLAIFLEKDNAKKKTRSKEFTFLLFEFVESIMKGKSEEEISSLQMEATGLFATYVFKKNNEKSKEKGKLPKQIFTEIAEESDELYDEIESRAWRD